MITKIFGKIAFYLKVKWMDFAANVRASAGGITNKIINIVVAAIVMSALLPYAITTLMATNQDGWAPELVTLWAVVPILVTIGLVVAIVYLALGRSR